MREITEGLIGRQIEIPRPFYDPHRPGLMIPVVDEIVVCKALDGAAIFGAVDEHALLVIVKTLVGMILKRHSRRPYIEYVDGKVVRKVVSEFMVRKVMAIA